MVDADADIETKPTPATATTADPVIDAIGVSKTFGDGGVLDNIDLQIHENTTTLLMGPNGSGKTVLLACLTGGLHPSEDEITVFGESSAAAGAERGNRSLKGRE